VRARPLNGISASAARYAGIVLVAMPNLMQPTRPTLQCSFVHACARRSRIGSAPDEGPGSVQTICEQPDFTDTHGAIRSVGTQLNRCEYWPRIAGRWASCHCTIAMTFKCLDCNLPIEGDSWWYDPLAHGMNAALPATAHRCRLATPRSTNACFSTISQGVLGEATGS
jgi:hypothetical protein